MTRARGMPHDPPRTLERSREVDVAEPAATIGAATVCKPCVTFSAVSSNRSTSGSSAAVVLAEERRDQPHAADRDADRSPKPDGTEQALRAIGNAVLRDPCQPDADPGGEHEGARGGLDRRDQRQDRAADDEHEAPVDAPVARDDQPREPVRERRSPTPPAARSAAPASGSSRHVNDDATRPDTLPLRASSGMAAMASAPGTISRSATCR